VGCLTCQPELLQWGTQCVSECPSGTYQDSKRCFDCISPCQTCVSQLDCITCLKSYYKVPRSTKCVLPEFCPIRTYADFDMQECQPCYFACLTCSGPRNKDCIKCDFENGFGRPIGSSGECLLLLCTDGNFLKIDPVLQKASCQKCHKSCKTCGNSERSGCITCNEGLVPYTTNSISFVECKGCGEVSQGYKLNLMNKCEEICGDGLNLGQYECDDGNNNDGDGCDKNCKIEEGFKCFKNDDQPDSCIDTQPPKVLTASIKSGNIIEIIFSEEIYITATSYFYL